MAPNERKLCPEAGTRILFAGATLYAEEIDVKKQRVQLTGAHRGKVATVDNGWIIIDKEWYAK